jgi:hypothetical protein
MPSDTEETLQADARRLFDTTLGDVVNAVRADTLSDWDAVKLVERAEAALPADHPEMCDDDPDDRLSWCMTDDGPAPERA